MKTNYNIKKQILLFFLLLISGFIFGQKKSILYNEITHHLEMGDFEKNKFKIFSSLDAATEQNNTAVQFIANQNAISDIIARAEKYVDFEIPFVRTQSKKLILKKRRLFDDESKVIIQNINGIDDTFKKEDCLIYSGLVSDNLDSSLVSIVFYQNKIFGSIFLNNKEYELSVLNEKSNIYKLSEIKMDNTIQSFKCAFDEASDLELVNSDKNQKQQNSTSKCLKLHFEITKALNDYSGGLNLTMTKFLNLFNVVQTRFANETVTVIISQLKIWNVTDPYYQTNGDIGFSSFQTLSGNINGNIGILLNNFPVTYAVGLSGGGVCPNIGYNMISIQNNFTLLNSGTILHEIGHSLGSKHTHWCGWVGGPIDNCAPTEGGCPAGPDPVNGGTIMSYCFGGGAINSVFGPQPNAVINNTFNSNTCITDCNSVTACEDNIVQLSSIITNSLSAITVYWTSAYPVKVYFKEQSAATYTLVNTIQIPNNSCVINYMPSNNGSFLNYEIKLVAVCPNGDSKPTVIVYSPSILSNNLFDFKNNIKIYPNPTNSIVNITTSNNTINQINVYDIYGRLLKSKKSNNENEQINIQDLPNAIYLLEVKTENIIETIKIVKQ